MAFKTPTDEELMSAYQQGDEQAFQLLYQRYSARVYGFLRRRVASREWQDEIFQAVFLKLHDNRRRYDRTFPFAPWLFTITRCVLIDSLRAKKRIPREESADFERLDSPSRPEFPTVQGMEELTPAQQQILTWRYWDDLSFESMALRLNTSPANVRQKISRIIRKLRGAR